MCPGVDDGSGALAVERIFCYRAKPFQREGSLLCSAAFFLAFCVACAVLMAAGAGLGLALAVVEGAFLNLAFGGLCPRQNRVWSLTYSISSSPKEKLCLRSLVVISAISAKPGCGALSARPHQATILQLVQQLSLTEQSCSTGALRGLRRMPRQQSILR